MKQDSALQKRKKYNNKSGNKIASKIKNFWKKILQSEYISTNGAIGLSRQTVPVFLFIALFSNFRAR